MGSEMCIRDRLPAARAGPTCVNTQAAPNRRLPFFTHCRHSPSRAPAATVEATVGWWTSAFIKPPLVYIRAEAGPKRPRDGREITHRRELRPAMAVQIRYLAQVQGEPLDVLLYEVRQAGPVPAEVSDGEMLHHMLVEHPGPVVERSAECVHESTRHVKIRRFLREPADRDRQNRMSTRC